MPVSIGSQLGSLEVTALLGKGGMGEVYRALDIKLKREVAIKILPEEFSHDTNRVNRFRREAEVLASLNHPNIAAIHSIGEANGSRFLVLELVEGQTLAERIQRGALPIDEALHIARGISDALEAAHEKGVIHRDVKPANVKVTPEGTVKVLDFGLAKAAESAPASGNLSQSPTISMTATQAGVILGTAAYMSPEQAKGLNADQRSDIFSFGAVLYEMLTGRQAFQGDSVSEVLASILTRDPDFTLMPPGVSPKLLALLRRSLEKNPKRRWYAIGDLRVELEDILAEPQGRHVEEQHVARSMPLWKRAAPVFAAIVLTAGITSIGMWYLKSSPPMRVSRLSHSLEEGQQFTNNGRSVIAISRDGSQFVYLADDRLYLRKMSEFKGREIPGSETWNGSLSPAFSPDGRSLAFWSRDKIIKKVALTGGPAVPLCPANNPFGISWGDDGITFGHGNKGIFRVSADGGNPESLVRIQGTEVALGPQVLPGGQALLYTLAPGPGADQWDKADVVVQSLKSGNMPDHIISGGSDARYVPSGHIVYAVAGILYAVPFDLGKLKITGGRVPVVVGVQRGNATGISQFSFSSTGDMVYIPGPATGTELTLAVRDRKQGEDLELLKLKARSYAYPRVSPDGKRIAFSTEDDKDSNIWIYDRGTGAMVPLTSGSANRYPIWIDNERVAFQSDRDGDLGIFWQRADGNDTAVPLTKPNPGVAHIPDSGSPDGQTLSFTEVNRSDRAVWTYSFKDRKTTLFAGKPSFSVGWSSFSPDGKWLAYQSDEAGKGPQVFVEPFPRTGIKFHLDTWAGQPVWSPSRERPELFYNPGPGQIAVVNVTIGPTSFYFGEPTSVPRGLINRDPGAEPRFWDIAPDGKQLIGVALTTSGSLGAPQINVILNWFEDLRQLMSTH